MMSIICCVSACFACCTETGLRIYNVEPVSPREKFGKSMSINAKGHGNFLGFTFTNETILFVVM